MADFRGVLIAGVALVVSCVGVVAMFKSRRPDPKMTFLMGLLDASADLERDLEAGDRKYPEPD